MSSRTPDPKNVIENFLAQDSQLHDSERISRSFLFFDESEQKPLVLNLPALINPNRIKRLSAGEYLVCTDMSTPQGIHYDLDFIFRTAGQKAGIERVMIHAVDGEARYDWAETSGTWKQKPVAPLTH